MRSRNRKFKTLTKLILAGVASLMMAAGPHNYKDTTRYKYNPDGSININSPKNLIADKELGKLIGMRMWEGWKKSPAWPKMRGVKHIFFLSRYATAYAVPLKAKPDLTMLEKALQDVTEEFRSYGIRRFYSLNPVLSKEDMLSGSNNVNIVNDLAETIEGKVRLHWHDKSIDTTYKTKRDGDKGNTITTLRFNVDTGSFYITRTEVFIEHPETPLQAYVRLYSELLHSELSPSTLHLLNSLLKGKRTGNSWTFKNESECFRARELTDEAIVHGLCNNWLLENYRILGLDYGEVCARINRFEKQPKYHGSIFVKNLASAASRPVVYREFKKDPVALWKSLKSRHPAP
ncbi:hypothetical protein KY328_03640 [Candidatus Woesearchaeota archaeon]|nr:hypothetical protein [Candidatus Woesearchaeota archaeon]MBW3021988.1 hypothetical protein [Candidatus Woesearchaeota archaeon]